MYRLGTIFRFEAEHKLPFEGGKESEKHSHEYKLEIIVSGNELDENGFLVDIVALKRIARETISHFEGRYLNDMEEMKGKVPSLENLAALIYQRAQVPMEKLGVKLDRIKLWEDDFSWTSYDGCE